LAIGRFFKSLVNAEVMGEEIVRSIIHLYEQTARYNPGDSTQDLLLKTYLARLKARRINIDDERVVLNAMADIHLPAQLPEGRNIKALALYCLFKERPDIIETYPKFAAEYERLMAPILEPSSVDDVSPERKARDKATPSLEEALEANRETTRRYLQERQARIQEQHVHDTTTKQGGHNAANGDKRQGYGVLTNANGDKFIGSWLNGKRHGSGTIKYADGSKFIGSWLDDKRHGAGTILYPDGREFSGSWRDDKRNGYGTISYPDGRILAGEWRDDQRQGSGEILYPDGRVSHLSGAIVRPQTR
jgi:hypothetical protein